MKHLLTSVFVVSIAACSSASAPITQQALFVLPNGQFVVDRITTDFSGALAHLGPPDTTQVNLTVCPNLTFTAVSKVKADVEAAGYKRIGFATIKPSDSALCANNSFKPKPLRGSA